MLSFLVSGFASTAFLNYRFEAFIIYEVVFGQFATHPRKREYCIINCSSVDCSATCPDEPFLVCDSNIPWRKMGGQIQQ